MKEQVIEVDIDLVEEPMHLLRTVDEKSPKFLDLLESMKADGWWTSKPAEVTKDGKRFVIVDGLTKLTAARRAGLKLAKVVVLTTKLGDIERLARSITANATVVETRPVEYGHALAKIMEERQGWTFVDLAKFVRKDVAWVQSRLNLTGLEGDAAKLVNEGAISIANGQALVRAKRAGIAISDELLERAQQEPASDFVPDIDAMRKAKRGPVAKLRQPGSIKEELERARKDKKTPKGYIEALEWALQIDPVSRAMKEST